MTQEIKKDPHDGLGFHNVVKFLKESISTIVFILSISLVCVTIFLTNSVQQYEARILVKSPRVNLTNDTHLNVTNFEKDTVDHLISRIKFPGFYSMSDVSACGLEGKDTSLPELVGMVSVIKRGVSDMELIVKAGSREQAISCVLNIFEVIKKVYLADIKILSEESKVRLDLYNRRLLEIKSISNNSDQSNTNQLIQIREEIHYLVKQIHLLKINISSMENINFELLGSVYSPKEPVYPNKSKSIVATLFFGLIIALLISIFRRVS